MYHLTLAFLVATSCRLAWANHRDHLRDINLWWKAAPADISNSNGGTEKFIRVFLPVYLLVMASDWLQGAYVYTLYKDEKHLPESTVASLFTCGFLAAAMAALVVGSLADRYGRRLACLAFCVLYTASCLTKISDSVAVLWAGRLLGGVCTTLLFSTFESWMVTECFTQGGKDASLYTMFGVMSTLNSIVAIASGLVGEGLVAATGTKVSPFLAACVCLVLAFLFMAKHWGENYGGSAELARLGLPEKSMLASLVKDKRVLLLGLISCCFEGSMYIFVFLWSAAMQSAHGHSTTATASAGKSDAHSPDGIPFGLIFATFMAAMMLGSQAFTYMSTRSISWTSRPSPDMLLTLAATVASISLVSTVLLKQETLTFWAFCLFEASLGIYFPAVGAQRAMLVGDGERAKTYGILRIPLNMFVVLSLATMVEGDSHRDMLFILCGGLLLLASLAAVCLESCNMNVKAAALVGRIGGEAVG
ncbi:major facilitator superfamily domain containing protein 5 [Ophiocordyceps sinensis CO18]|nr:major facilitator superfamily domain containing protein 5 [Ophiocordyceps sinensis CO18]